MTARVATSALRHLVTKVEAYFEAHEVTATVTCGFKARTSQVTQGPGRANRVVIVPGALNGAGGRIGMPRDPGPRPIYTDDADEAEDTVVGSVRSLGDWDRQLTLSVWAHDGDAPTDELAQIEAVETLFEWATRALHATGLASLLLADATWTVPKERGFGMELLVGMTLQHPIYDVPVEIGFPSFSVNRLGTGTGVDE